jgi:hypothetical protein
MYDASSIMYKSLVNSVSIVDTCSTQYWLFYHCRRMHIPHFTTGDAHPEGSLLLYSFIEQVEISFTPTPGLGP